MLAHFDYPVSVVEAETAVVFCLDADLKITYCNPAWDRFALENGGSQLIRPAPVGHSVLEYITGPTRDFYARAYRRVLAQGQLWEHEYECSSQDIYRKFRLRVIPMQRNPGLFVMNFLVVQCEHVAASSPPLQEVYRNPYGLITMCASCRRARRNPPDAKIWDWVPGFVGQTPTEVTHGICPACRQLYYPEE